MEIKNPEKVMETVKEVVGGVSGFGAGLIIFNAIQKVVPVKMNVIMKMVYGLGGAALADVVGDVATKHMSEMLDAFNVSVTKKEDPSDVKIEE